MTPPVPGYPTWFFRHFGACSGRPENEIYILAPLLLMSANPCINKRWWNSSGSQHPCLNPEVHQLVICRQQCKASLCSFLDSLNESWEGGLEWQCRIDNCLPNLRGCNQSSSSICFTMLEIFFLTEVMTKCVSTVYNSRSKICEAGRVSKAHQLIISYNHDFCVVCLCDLMFSCGK